MSEQLKSHIQYFERACPMCPALLRKDLREPWYCVCIGRPKMSHEETAMWEAIPTEIRPEDGVWNIYESGEKEECGWVRFRCSGYRVTSITIERKVPS